MLEGMYSAAAGMAAQQQQLDAVANDLANVSTTGYKKVRLAFRDLLYQEAGLGATNGVTVGSGSATADLGRSHTQGALLPTGRTLDIAIEGAGFLQVRRSDGSTALTRDGSLQVDGDGRLMTSSGDLVQPAITLPKGTNVNELQIGADGAVSAGGTRIGTIELVGVRHPGGLQSVGDNLFATTAASGDATRTSGSGIRQGVLEASNVEMGTAIVDMISAQRGFQLTSQAVQMQDRMWEIANGVKR